MADATPPPRPPAPDAGKSWTERISRSGYFFGAVLLHLIVFLMVATWVVFPAFKPPAEDFVKTYLPSGPPPPPVTPPAMQVPTTTVAAPSTTIISPAVAPAFTVPLPDLSPGMSPATVSAKTPDKMIDKPNALSPERLQKIMETEAKWGRDRQNILNSAGDPKNVVAKFPVYLAYYAEGDWGYGQNVRGGKIVSGSLCNMVAKINEWSSGKITGEVEPTPLDISGPELLDKKPPFIFFTGHRNFTLSEQEIQNLRDYLQIGGAIWGDNSLPGKGSRFDVAFRREMKRVIPSETFEPLAADADIFKGRYQFDQTPQGMNYLAEPIEHVDLDGKIAILYTPNDYSDLYTMCILPGDEQIKGTLPTPDSPLATSGLFLGHRNIYFRNYTLQSSLRVQQLGLNIVTYLVTRFDDVLILPP